MSKKSPSKKPSPAKVAAAKRQAQLGKLVKEAKANRAANKNILRELKDDPGYAEDVKKLLCADLVRVSEIPRAILGPSASRDRYRQFGNYSTSLVDFIFGMWAEFKRQAGLEDTLHTKTVKRNVAKTSRAQNLARYADQHVKPWDGAYPKLNLNKKKLAFMTMSDLHSAFCNPFALRVCQDINKRYLPDGVKVNGDLVDFPSLSTHRHFPGHFPMTAKDECTWARKEVWAPLRKNNPKADLEFLIGNHDVRLMIALADKGPMFACFDEEMGFDKVFGLDEYQIGLSCRSNFLFQTAKQRERDIAQNWSILFSKDGRPLFVWVHGWLTGKNSAEKHAKQFMIPGTNGHLHSRETVSVGSLATGVIDWEQTPCMAHPRAVAAGYIHGPIEAQGWSCGALWTTVDMVTGHIHNEPIKVGDDIATFRDQVWKITQRERDQIAEMLTI